VQAIDYGGALLCYGCVAVAVMGGGWGPHQHPNSSPGGGSGCGIVMHGSDLGSGSLPFPHSPGSALLAGAAASAGSRGSVATTIGAAGTTMGAEGLHAPSGLPCEGSRSSQGGSSAAPALPDVQARPLADPCVLSGALTGIAGEGWRVVVVVGDCLQGSRTNAEVWVSEWLWGCAWGSGEDCGSAVERECGASAGGGELRNA